MTITRRHFVRSIGVAAAAGALAPPSFVGRALAQAAPGRVLVCLFQRGGVDGLSMIVPHGDAGYYRDRPNVAIAPPGTGDGRAIELDGHFGLHPAMRTLKDLWDGGELAAVHAVGSPHPSRSHFEAQHHMEAGVPGRPPDRQGWLNRVLQARSGDTLSAVALGGGVPESLAGPAPVFAVRRLSRMRAPHVGSGTRGDMRDGLESLYADPSELGREMRTGLRAFDRLARVGRARGQPANGARYPGRSPGHELRDVARLIKADIGLKVAFVGCGGWDTHSGQGGAEGRLARSLRDLAESLVAFRQDLGDRMENVVLLTMSEFGRTVAQNGTAGTDHGHGTAMLVLGGPVRGGRVAGEWPGLAPDQRWEGRDLAITTDFRDLFGEVAQRHLGVTDLQSVFPGHQPAATRFPGVLRGRPTPRRASLSRRRPPSRSRQ